MEPSCTPVSRDHGAVRPTLGRPFRLGRQPSSPEVFLTVLGSQGGSHGCPPPFLAFGPSIRFSSFSINLQGPQEGNGGAGGDHSPSPALALETLVRGLGVPICLVSLAHPRRSDCPHPGGSSTPGSDVVPLNRLEIERGLLMRANVSASVISTIQASRRESTNCIYNATWAFVSWC